ncbi:MAG: nucleotidyltransferase domain-containing protein [Planctomycetes bacterium]|nr:nucleotidyltransferase domain-containing protein [Planctomycetota bacterium]
MIALIEEHRAQLGELCRAYDVRRLDLIGSAAHGGFDPARSDLDFVVEFNNFTVRNAADRFFGLLVDLEDLFGRRIDLISYCVIRNPAFKRVVDESRVTLYAA